MAKKNRSLLKERFKSGLIPSEGDFGDLIDSMVNTLEEGFEKTLKDGLKISPLMGSERLLSFYEELAVDSPRWFLELGPKIGSRPVLRFAAPGRGEGEASNVLTLRCDEKPEKAPADWTGGRVGINTADPQWELDVKGVVAGHGWKGRDGELEVLADGEWHDMTPGMTGCNILEIVAGVGAQDSDGKYALLHATAMNTFNSKDHSIKCHSVDSRHAFFGGKSSRIELQWVGVPGEGKFTYKLQMRVAGYLDKAARVKYHITKKWFDVLMEDSGREPSA